MGSLIVRVASTCNAITAIQEPIGSPMDDCLPRRYRHARLDRDSALVSRSIFVPTTWLWFIYYLDCFVKYRSFDFMQSGMVRVRTAGTKCTVGCLALELNGQE